MAYCKQIGISDIPDVILEDHVLAFLSFDDLHNLMKLGNKRLTKCIRNVSRKKPFGKQSFIKLFNDIM